MIEYLIPRVLHIDSEVKDRPQYDTLIALCNPFNAAQWVQIDFYDCDGNVAHNSPISYLLKAGRSFATTLIKGNVFTDVPQNFQGYAKVSLVDTALAPGLALPITVCLGGGGPVPMHWNYSTPNVPVYGVEPSVVKAAKRWVFPYVIPHFTDLNHQGEHSYVTGLSLTNLGDGPCSIRITYTIGDFYADAGHQVQANLCIQRGCSVVKQVHELLPEVLQYNSEGWLDIQSDRPVELIGYALNANRDFNYLGWGSVPTIIE